MKNKRQDWIKQDAENGVFSLKTGFQQVKFYLFANN
jgi:hypothetical protein